MLTRNTSLLHDEIVHNITASNLYRFFQWCPSIIRFYCTQFTRILTSPLHISGTANINYVHVLYKETKTLQQYCNDIIAYWWDHSYGLLLVLLSRPVVLLHMPSPIAYPYHNQLQYSRGPADISQLLYCLWK